MAKCKFCDKGGKLKAGSKAERLLTDKLCSAEFRGVHGQPHEIRRNTRG